MLRKIRLTFAIIFFMLITLLFLDFTGTLHAWFGWLAKIQFLPAVLALNVSVIVLLIALTLVFGRIYCSVICPLGVFQDAVAWVGKRRKKLPYSYSPAIFWLRYGVLAIFIVTLVAGVTSVSALLAPYSAYGRIVSNLFLPLWQWGNHGLAYLAERAGSYAFYDVDVWIKSIPVFTVAVVTSIILIVLAGRNGRTYCNTICPVGTILGFLSRYSLFRITINENKCNNCGLCSHKCKAACINSKEHKIDYSRCVACMDCLDECRHHAISFVPTWKPKQLSEKNTPSDDNTNLSRRRALSATVLVAMTSALNAQKKKVDFVEMKKDGGLAPIKERKDSDRQTRLVPPGALSIQNLTQHCTACQLCVSACSNHVLQPSSGLMTIMQPEMSFEKGYCRPECVKCSEVCPTGAIRPITKADKSAIQIGHAVWIKDNCIVLTNDVNCGNCARHCPTEAIRMVPSDPDKTDSRQIPVINIERCIGCGSCEHLCPSRPYSAIYVEGHERHRII